MATLKYKIPEGYKIVGYEIHETIWNNEPNRVGWDNVKEIKTVDKVSSQTLGEKTIEKIAGDKPLCNFQLQPIFVRTSI